MVPLAGLEPARLAAFDFESNASTNFTTGAVAASLNQRTQRSKGACRARDIQFLDALRR